MGSGKTAVGRALARRLMLPFADSDAEVESRTGVDIAYIFEREGEEGFRIREREAIDILTSAAGIVLATGGGAILDADNRRVLAAHGYVVYLHASVDQQLHRTARADNRPLLQNVADRRGVLSTLFAQRDPLYREIADLIVNTDGRNAKTLVHEIERGLDGATAPI
jgi:shikimate kinase